MASGGHAQNGLRPATADRILDGAERVLSRKGVRGTSMEDIARAAGVTRMTVYRYYGSRDVLLRAFIERVLSRFQTELGKRALEVAGKLPPDQNPAFEIIFESMRYTICEFTCSPIAESLIENDPELILPYLSIRADFVIGHVVAAQSPIFDRWIEEGWIAPLPSDWLVDWLGRLAMSLRYQPSPSFDARDPATLRRILEAFVWPVIDPSRGAAQPD